MKLADAIDNDAGGYEIEYRVHAARRMFQRDVLEDDVETILFSGEIIERYEDDFPLPSMLINGRTSANRPMHLVAAVNTPEKKLVVITVYEPDPAKWEDYYFRRTER